MPLFDMILGEAGVIRYELELPRAQFELTSRLATATLLKPAHPGGSKKNKQYLIKSVHEKTEGANKGQRCTS